MPSRPFIRTGSDAACLPRSGASTHLLLPKHASRRRGPRIAQFGVRSRSDRRQLRGHPRWVAVHVRPLHVRAGGQPRQIGLGGGLKGHAAQPSPIPGAWRCQRPHEVLSQGFVARPSLRALGPVVRAAPLPRGSDGRHLGGLRRALCQRMQCMSVTSQRNACASRHHVTITLFRNGPSLQTRKNTLAGAGQFRFSAGTRAPSATACHRVPDTACEPS
jgi:hypothetical protein